MNKRIETIPRETVDALCDYPWPGNVRELENFVERSVILSQSAELQAPLKAPTALRISLQIIRREAVNLVHFHLKIWSENILERSWKGQRELLVVKVVPPRCWVADFNASKSNEETRDEVKIFIFDV